MYKTFYELQDNPFRLSPDPRYFLFSGRIKGIYDQLLYGIEQGVGFMMVTGEVGVGKTSFIRYFLKQLDKDIERVLLYNPTLERSEELLKYILLDVGCGEDISPQAGKAELLLIFLRFLMENHRKGRKFLLIIDEAQTLTDELLEEIRLLSNLESDDEKLLQIVLMGQPELKKRISRASLRQLRQRIAICAELSPLNRDEVQTYLHYRLSVGGGSMNIFDPRAIKAVHRATKGIPRLINLVAERSLIAGYITSKSVVSRREVRAALEDLNVA